MIRSIRLLAMLAALGGAGYAGRRQLVWLLTKLTGTWVGVVPTPTAPAASEPVAASATRMESP